MDLIYPHGTIVECVHFLSTTEIVPGKRAVILRKNENFEYEATVKELVLQDDEIWAVPRSTNPSHRPFKLCEPDAGILEVSILAIVVASVRPE